MKHSKELRTINGDYTFTTKADAVNIVEIKGSLIIPNGRKAAFPKLTSVGGSIYASGADTKTAFPKLTIVGIDPGVNTGFAVVDNGELSDVLTLSFTEAQAWCLKCRARYAEQGNVHTLELVIEDPRGQYVPYGQREPQRIKGVGSVERDCKLWIEFCEFYGIKYRLVKPGKYRTIDADTFKKWTGWQGRTSEHARAAAMMVWSGSNVTTTP